MHMLQGTNQLVKYLLLFAPEVVVLSFVGCVVAGIVSMVTCIYGVCVYGDVYLWCVLQALFPMVTCIYGV